MRPGGPAPVPHPAPRRPGSSVRFPNLPQLFRFPADSIPPGSAPASAPAPSPPAVPIASARPAPLFVDGPQPRPCRSRPGSRPRLRPGSFPGSPASISWQSSAARAHALSLAAALSSSAGGLYAPGTMTCKLYIKPRARREIICVSRQNRPRNFVQFYFTPSPFRGRCERFCPP